MNDVVVPGAVVHHGHALEVLRQLEAESVHTVVTSPPYWGLRAYKSEPQTWGGDPECDHDWQALTWRGISGGTASIKVQTKGTDNFQVVPATQSSLCSRCAAWRGELGLEPTPELFVQHIVEVFREVRRVLRSDGTAWVNFGDCYQGGDRGKATKSRVTSSVTLSASHNQADMPDAPNRLPVPGLKPKDLVGMPWRVAFGLQADGWWLRSDIIWHKPNPMPESIRDRPTKAHEYLFLLAKSERYFYDTDAVRERTGTEVTWEQWEIAEGRHVKPGNIVDGVGRPSTREAIGGFGSKPESFTHPAGRNKRTVWTISTTGYPGAHFATFPEDLVTPCIKAGTSEEGCCPQCGAPWRRVVEKSQGYAAHAHVPTGWDLRDGAHGGDGWEGRRTDVPRKADTTPRHDGDRWNENNGRGFRPKQDEVGKRQYTGFNDRWDATEHDPPGKTVGWEPTCGHYAPEEEAPVPCTVLDPFAGSGTTLAVAKKLGRRSIGIELQSAYLPLIKRRLERASLPLLDELDFESPRQIDLVDFAGERT